MDKEDIKIPKYVVKVLAEKLREFVEDNEKSFKFHPWQVTSTLNKIQKSLHSGLPERAIHRLYDTGAAEEIMKFSKGNEKSVKLGKVKNYLYSQLGLYSNMPRALENGCQIVYPESQLYDAMRRNRIFEMRRLIDAIIHQLEQTIQKSKQNGNVYQIQLNNLNKFSNTKAPKQQALAHCNYTCCLFYGHDQRNEKKKILKRSPRGMKINFIKRNIKTTAQKYPHRKSTQQNSVQKIYLSPRSVPAMVRAKTLVDSTTQTTWSLKAPRRDSMYEDEVMDISNEEESMESESDFYCKSDTLNDASMITDQIASDFLHDVTPIEVKTEVTLSRKKSSKSSAMSRISESPISPTKEGTKTNSRNNVSNEPEMNDNSISSLNSIKLEAIEGTVNLFKSMELRTNTDTKLKTSLIENSKHDASDLKCLELDVTQNNVTNSKSVDSEISQKNMTVANSVEAEVMSNNSTHSNSSKLETVKDSKIHSKSHHSGENRNNISQSKDIQIEKTENSITNSKPAKLDMSSDDLKNIVFQPDLHVDSPTHHDSEQQNQENNRVTKKLRKPKKPLLGLISSYARKVALSRCKTSLLESVDDRKAALSRCKTSLIESMEDQPESKEQKDSTVNENSQKLPTENQENGMIHEMPNSDTNLLDTDKAATNELPLESGDLVAKKEEKETGETVKNIPKSKPIRKYMGDSFESILNSEEYDTTYCPKSSVSISDHSLSASETDEASDRSSLKENDNISVEYSSHWTMEYSSTEASESEDEVFKEKFKEYKKHLLEDDEGIAASCEEESSFGMEYHMKEMAVMSAESKRSLMKIAKQNDGFPTFSYDEDTSYFMDTVTFDENLEYQQISYSIVTQEGTELIEETCIRHDESGENKSPTYEEVPYEETIGKENEDSLKNKEKETNDSFNINAGHIAGNEGVDDEKACNMNNSNADDRTTYKDHLSSNKSVQEAETSLDADEISSNLISQERGYSSISVDEVAYQNSQEIENISKIFGEFPLKRDNTITENNNDILDNEELSVKDTTKINDNNATSTDVKVLESENIENKDEFSIKSGENIDGEFQSENIVEESKEMDKVISDKNDSDDKVELCEDVQSKEEDESKECFSEKVLSNDVTPNESEADDNAENKKIVDKEELHDDAAAIENEQEGLDLEVDGKEFEEIPKADTKINEDRESQDVKLLSSHYDETAQDLNSNGKKKNSSLSESNKDLEKLNKDENMVENASGDDEDNVSESKVNVSDEIDENVISVIEDIQETGLDLDAHEDLSEEYSQTHKTVLDKQEIIPGENDAENEVQDDQTKTLDPPLCEVDTIEDDDINEDEDEKSHEETATLKVNSQMYKKSHSTDEDVKTKRLLKVLSLTDSQPFQDIDMMHEDLLEIVDVDGWNMLHLAASKGLENFLKKVLKHGLSTEDLTDDNHTALQLAVIKYKFEYLGNRALLGTVIKTFAVNNLKCCQILLKHGASLTTKEGSFDEDFMQTAGDISSNIKDLIENYKCNYMKVQNLAEIINEFSSEKKDLSQPLPKNILQILAEITIEDEDIQENDIELTAS